MTLVIVTDLCGRNAPYHAPLNTLDEREQLEELIADWPDRNVWCLGEIEYRLVDAGI